MRPKTPFANRIYIVLCLELAHLQHHDHFLPSSILTVVFPPLFITVPNTLSECELQVLATLSGCQPHNDAIDCTDYCLHSKYRSYDGTCNNAKHPRFGAAGTALPRLLEADYENDINLPRGWSQTDPFSPPKPSTRVISTQLFSAQNVSGHNRNTLMLMQIGQFLDHDLDMTPIVPSDKVFVNGSKCDELCGNEPPCFPIIIPPNDTRIRNAKCMAFTRSSAVCGSGSGSVLVGKAAYRREQINSITSFVDASQVYGSSEDLATRLREPGTGKLRMGNESAPGKHFLEFDTESLVDCMQPHEVRATQVPCFLAGDVRVNEHVALTSMHTLLSREHNRIAEKLVELNPHWSSEKTYQEARKILGAEWQSIIYNFYLPTIVGPNGMQKLGEYKGYNSNINPGIVNAFATAAYRFGHSQIMPFLPRFDKNWKETSDGHLPLFQAFFSPFRLVQEGGIDPLLRGLISTPVKLRTPQEVMTSSVVERLFEESNQIALDLGALNIQRGRDHGIPGYNQFRSYCDLSVANTFDDLAAEIPDSAIRDKLQTLYGHPDNIDLMVGGMLEEVEEGGHLGPTFKCIIVEQFKRLRDGDRFWFQNPGKTVSICVGIRFQASTMQIYTLRKSTFNSLCCLLYTYS